MVDMAEKERLNGFVIMLCDSVQQPYAVYLTMWVHSCWAMLRTTKMST